MMHHWVCSIGLKSLGPIFAKLIFISEVCMKKLSNLLTLSLITALFLTGCNDGSRDKEKKRLKNHTFSDDAIDGAALGQAKQDALQILKNYKADTGLDSVDGSEVAEAGKSIVQIVYFTYAGEEKYTKKQLDKEIKDVKDRESSTDFQISMVEATVKKCIEDNRTGLTKVRSTENDTDDDEIEIKESLQKEDDEVTEDSKEKEKEDDIVSDKDSEEKNNKDKKLKKYRCRLPRDIVFTASGFIFGNSHTVISSMNPLIDILTNIAINYSNMDVEDHIKNFNKRVGIAILDRDGKLLSARNEFHNLKKDELRNYAEKVSRLDLIHKPNIVIITSKDSLGTALKGGTLTKATADNDSDDESISDDDTKEEKAKKRKALAAKRASERENLDLKNGEDVYILGYTTTNVGPAPAELSYGKGKLLSQEKCSVLLKAYSGNTDIAAASVGNFELIEKDKASVICSSAPGEATMSGGPMLNKNGEVIGIFTKTTANLEDNSEKVVSYGNALVKKLNVKVKTVTKD